jgi:murein L,D-transpeptidase YcbB/YkuD
VAAYCIPSYEEFGSRVLQRGMCGSDVAELMRLLVAHGRLESYQVNSESMFTQEVENAVRAFQRANRKKADGKVGPVTAGLLRRNP